MDRIKAIDEKYSAQGYQVIAINPNDPAKVPEDSFEAMKARASEKGFNFPYLFDDGQKSSCCPVLHDESEKLASLVLLDGLLLEGGRNSHADGFFLFGKHSCKAFSRHKMP